MLSKYKLLNDTNSTSTYSAYDFPYEKLWNFDDVFGSTKPTFPTATPVSQNEGHGSMEYDYQSSVSSNFASLASPTSSNDTFNADWNRPTSRTPITESLRDIWTAENGRVSPLNSLGSINQTPPDYAPCSNQSLRSYVHNSCFCEVCEMMREFDRAYENDYNYYADVRRHFENNGRDVSFREEDEQIIPIVPEANLQFTPQKDNCSTPFMLRKPLSDINNNVPYFVPQCSPIKEEVSHVSCNDQNLNDWQMDVAFNTIPKAKTNGKNKHNKQELATDYCVFCFNNHEHEMVYKSHTVKDAKGRVLCPRLRIYECPICGKDGDEAHTTKYCKERKTITPADTQKWVEQKGKKEMERFKNRNLRTMVL